MLRKNEASLDEALRVFPAFTRIFANASGKGAWLDGYLGGLNGSSGLRRQIEEALAVPSN
jgi:phospholipid/cholesterol/gamma-HCH transport system substrate-binding protein